MVARYNETPNYRAVATSEIVKSVTGWMDEAGCLEYVRATFPHSTVRKLLIWDSFRGHLTDAVKAELRSRNVDVAVIPGGLTCMLQPLDVSINKPFKDRIRDLWAEWMVEGDHSFTLAGNQRAPPKELLVKWTKQRPCDMWIRVSYKCL